MNNIVLEGYKYDKRLINITISIEDRRFRYHFGHDIFSIARAILNNLTKKRIQGASTIEQQIIRIILDKKEITLKRKILEITLSTELNRLYSKDEIINLYLSCYVFSKDLIGVKSLCDNENYSLKDLLLTDIFEITARFKYPNITKNNYLRFLKRVRTIEKINNST